MESGTHTEDDNEKLYWQVEALKGQVRELERDRNNTGNLLWAIRYLLIRALLGLGEEADFKHMSDVEVVLMFNRVTQLDYRFSRCPNASTLHCRPVAMQLTRDDDPVYCEDCGWSVVANPLPIKKKEENNRQDAKNTEKKSAE